jgi:segregation and condensation protein B
MAFPEEDAPRADDVDAPDAVSPPEPVPASEAVSPPGALSPDDMLPAEPAAEAVPLSDVELKAVLEAIVYITDEPLSLDQICATIEQPRERVTAVLEQLAADYEKPDRGLSIREVAGGFKMTTKPEHHEAVRRFVKNLNPPLKLSLPALETLAVIAYKQPVTAPEIMEIRGVQGAGVLKTLLDRKLIGVAGRKQVVGKPILYRTTREFLVQFGLKDLAELPTLKEFQEIGRFDTEGPGLQQPETVRTESRDAAEAAGDAESPDSQDPEPESGTNPERTE